MERVWNLIILLNIGRSATVYFPSSYQWGKIKCLYSLKLTEAYSWTGDFKSFFSPLKHPLFLTWQEYQLFCSSQLSTALSSINAFTILNHHFESDLDDARFNAINFYCTVYSSELRVSQKFQYITAILCVILQLCGNSQCHYRFLYSGCISLLRMP